MDFNVHLGLTDEMFERCLIQPSFLINMNLKFDFLHLNAGKQFRAVIISTVRTRVINSRQDVDSELDYRLLSDPKLVNTAFTRAQSVLCVVGDPVALCSVGRCSTIWQDFLKCCEQNESLHPLVSQVFLLTCKPPQT